MLWFASFPFQLSLWLMLRHKPFHVAASSSTTTWELQKLYFFNVYIVFLCEFTYTVWIQRPKETRRGWQVSRNWSYWWLWATMCVLESGARALTCWAISPGPLATTFLMAIQWFENNLYVKLVLKLHIYLRQHFIFVLHQDLDIFCGLQNQDVNCNPRNAIHSRSGGAGGGEACHRV